MKTFLEVEGKMGPIPVPAPSNQFRPPLPETIPNVRKNDVTEKRKRATPKEVQTSNPQTYHSMHPPLLEDSTKAQEQHTPTFGTSERRHPMVWHRQDVRKPLLRTELGYSLKTIWPLKTKMRMQLL